MSESTLAIARRICLTGVVGLWLSLAGRAAAASLSARDVQIIAKALGFLQPPPAGGAVAVVYDPANAASRTDAEAIVALFGDGLAAAGGVVTAKAVDARALSDARGCIAVILAAGTAGAGVQGILSICATEALVQSGHCIMSVQSQPKVEITVNRAAAQAAGVSFTAAFAMLVHEI